MCLPSGQGGTVVLDSDDELPSFHRTVQMPGTFWRDAQSRAAGEGKTLHELVHNALDAEVSLFLTSEH